MGHLANALVEGTPLAPPDPDEEAPSFGAPPGLEVWTLSVEGEEFALLGWPAPSAGTGRTLLGRLSPAESAVVVLAGDGRSNAEVAALRGCATRTIANQLASAFRKLGVRSRLELYALLARGAPLE